LWATHNDIAKPSPDIRWMRNACGADIDLERFPFPFSFSFFDWSAIDDYPPKFIKLAPKFNLIMDFYS